MSWDFWLIFAVLAFLIPWRGRVRLRRLLSAGEPSVKEKITLYLTTIFFQWMLAGAVAWRALARGLTLADLGCSPAGFLRLLLPGFLGALVLGGLHGLNLRRLGGGSGPARDELRRLASRVLPHTLLEFVPYFALAITAGVCEEFLYRGFAMAALSRIGLSNWMVVLLTSLLFGIAHLYQGRGGVAGTSLLGLLFGSFRILYGSIVPVALWHATIDLVAGVAGPRYFSGPPAEPPAGQQV